MHDDQHGTAVVVLAGLLNALKLANKTKEDVKIIINGAGAAGIAITKLLLKYGFKNIIILDSKGIIHKGRDNLNPIKEEITDLTNLGCKNWQECLKGDLKEAIKGTDIFIGVSKPDLLTEEMIKSMNHKPIIFALSNPIPEIMPDKAKKAGAFIVATGRSDFPNQVNNVLAFPGIFRGALDIRAKQITDEMKIAAAEALANSISQPTIEEILPNPLDKSIVLKIATAVKKAYK
jgi:malate dehydrogenase (oxaloacetate-decarboxylating)